MFNYLDQLSYGAKRSWYYSKDNVVLIGMLAATLFPTVFLVERYMTTPAFDTAWFRLIPTIAALPLLFYKKLPTSWKLNFHIYWFVALVICVPFNYSTVFILNAALSTETVSPVWMFEFLFSVFLLILFTSHTVLATTILILGCSLGACSLLFVESPNWEAIYQEVIKPSPVLITSFVVLVLLNRTVFRAREQELRAVGVMGNWIAHELRTPLASIRALANGGGTLLPVLVETYDKAVARGDIDRPLRATQLQTLHVAHEQIVEQVDHANTVIDMLLLNTIPRPSVGIQYELFSVEQLLREAIAKFPYNNSRERNMVRLEGGSDFKVYAPRSLVLHVIFNLLKNGLRFTQRAKGTEVVLTFDTEKGNTVRVRDDGVGVANEHRHKLFQLFFTTEQHGEGNGIGLNFCKMTMETIGGSISYCGGRGRTSEFVLTFPAIASRFVMDDV